MMKLEICFEKFDLPLHRRKIERKHFSTYMKTTIMYFIVVLVVISFWLTSSSLLSSSLRCPRRRCPRRRCPRRRLRCFPLPPLRVTHEDFILRQYRERWGVVLKTPLPPLLSPVFLTWTYLFVQHNEKFPSRRTGQKSVVVTNNSP